MSPLMIIEYYFNDFAIIQTGKRYYKDLPEDLADWYCYRLDAGHCILTLIEGHFDENNTDINKLVDDLVPCSVKSVLKGYRIHQGFPVTKIKYDSLLGVITDPEDEEF